MCIFVLFEWSELKRKYTYDIHMIITKIVIFLWKQLLRYVFNKILPQIDLLRIVVKWIYIAILLSRIQHHEIIPNESQNYVIEWLVTIIYIMQTQSFSFVRSLQQSFPSLVYYNSFKVIFSKCKHISFKFYQYLIYFKDGDHFKV